MNEATQHQIEALVNRFPRLTFKKGELLFRPFEPLAHVFFLKSGFVHAYATSEAGNELTVNIFRPGSIIPLSQLLDKNLEENLYSYEALGPVTANKIPKAKMLALIDENPALMNFFLRRFGAALNRSSIQLEAVIFGTAAQKVAAALYLTYVRFSRLDLGGREKIAFLLTHRQLANMTGLTRETVSSEMIKFKREKLVYYRTGKITILEPDRLKELSSISHHFDLG